MSNTDNSYWLSFSQDEEQLEESDLEWHIKRAENVISKHINLAKYDCKYHPSQLCLELDREMTSSQYRKIGELVEESVNIFVHRLATKLKDADSRFDISAVYPTGSYSEKVKIGEPDEFDYIFELNTRQTLKQLKFISACYPGFVHIDLQDCRELTDWKNCIENVCHIHGKRDNSCKLCQRKSEIYPSLAPELIQEKFRKLLDKVVPTIDLPSNLSHSGFERPHYSGFRKHGPATLLQFRFKNMDRITQQVITILLSVDITLAIKVPTPTALDIFGIDFHLKQNCCNTELRERIKHWIEYAPGIHVIPLYSNLLIAIDKPEEKFAWRVSCSLVEKEIFNSLSNTSLPKVCLRVLKTLRDVYLTEGYKKKAVKRSRSRSVGSRRTTERMDNKTQKRNVSCSQRNPRLMSQGRRSREMNVSIPNNNDISLHSYLFNKEYTTMASYMAKSKFNSGSDEEEDNESSASSENLFYAEPLMLELHKRSFQSQEINRVSHAQRPGEFYGLSQLLASMELKTYCLQLIDKVEDLDNLSQMTFHIYKAIEQFYQRAANKNTLIKNYLLKGAVVSPRSDDKREKLLKKMQTLISTLNTLAKWTVTAEDVHVLTDAFKQYGIK